MNLRDTAAAWWAAGRPACIVELQAVRGSTPREAGARMLVAAEDACGSIGGGHLEWRALREARSALAPGAPLPQPQVLSLGPSLGQCCGGEVTLAWRRLDAQALADWPEPPLRLALHLFGAGHVARALVRLLAPLEGVRIVWIDEREEEFAHFMQGGTAWPAPVEIRCVDAVEAEVATLPAGGAALVMTHEHALDERLVEALLRREDLGWLGLIGSASKRARFGSRLRARGLAEARFERLHCPVGVPGLLGKAPEEIAIAIAAQLLRAHPPRGGAG